MCVQRQAGDFYSQRESLQCSLHRRSTSSSSVPSAPAGFLLRGPARLAGGREALGKQLTHSDRGSGRTGDPAIKSVLSESM